MEIWPRIQDLLIKVSRDVIHPCVQLLISSPPSRGLLAAQPMQAHPDGFCGGGGGLTLITL